MQTPRATMSIFISYLISLHRKISETIPLRFKKLYQIKPHEMKTVALLRLLYQFRKTNQY